MNEVEKDKVLLLVSESYPLGTIASMVNLNTSHATGFFAGQKAQCDADWERVKPLVEALEDLADRPCFAELLGEATDGCGCPSCTAKDALVRLSEGVKP